MFGWRGQWPVVGRNQFQGAGAGVVSNTEIHDQSLLVVVIFLTTQLKTLNSFQLLNPPLRILHVFDTCFFGITSGLVLLLVLCFVCDPLCPPSLKVSRVGVECDWARANSSSSNPFIWILSCFVCFVSCCLFLFLSFQNVCSCFGRSILSLVRYFYHNKFWFGSTCLSDSLLIWYHCCAEWRPFARPSESVAPFVMRSEYLLLDHTFVAAVKVSTSEHAIHRIRWNTWTYAYQSVRASDIHSASFDRSSVVRKRYRLVDVFRFWRVCYKDWSFCTALYQYDRTAFSKRDLIMSDRHDFIF